MLSQICSQTSGPFSQIFLALSLMVYSTWAFGRAAKHLGYAPAIATQACVAGIRMCAKRAFTPCQCEKSLETFGDGFCAMATAICFAILSALCFVQFCLIATSGVIILSQHFLAGCLVLATAIVLALYSGVLRQSARTLYASVCQVTTKRAA
jgi:hypothetical protein